MTVKPKGRPRSEIARQAILTAAAELLNEVGFEALTIDAIAKRAGSSRQTIYRWWRSLAAVVADAVVSGYVAMPQFVIPNSGALGHDLKTWIHSVAEGHSSAQQVVRALAIAASEDTDAANSLYEQITGPHYSALVERLALGQAKGQLPAEVNTQAIADALIGTVLFQALARRQSLERLRGVVDVLVPEIN